MPYQSQQYATVSRADHRERNIVIAVVALGAVALVVAAAFVVVLLSSQPNFALTNFDVELTGSAPYCTAHYSFTLVNSGGTGYARVEYKADDIHLGVSNYLVQARSQLSVTRSVSAPDCALHIYSAEIIDEWAA